MLPNPATWPLPYSVLAALAAIAVLWKAADWFVEGAVGLADTLKVPPMLIGLVVVSLATTSPELVTSVLAAMRDTPEVALGNAVGSVIVDVSVALGLAAVFASAPLAAHPGLIRSSGTFLAGVIVLTFLMLLDGVLARWQGGVLVLCFVVYSIHAYFKEVRRLRRGAQPATALGAQLEEVESCRPVVGPLKIATLFLCGLAGVLLGSEMLLNGALGISHHYHVPPVLIGMTVIAIGTSAPEIATALASARKGESALGVGNIVGSDILNICWVAGMSAMANPLPVERRVLFASYPSMMVIVLVMLFMLRRGYNLNRINGLVLLTLYVTHLLVLRYFVPLGTS